MLCRGMGLKCHKTCKKNINCQTCHNHKKRPVFFLLFCVQQFKCCADSQKLFEALIAGLHCTYLCLTCIALYYTAHHCCILGCRVFYCTGSIPKRTKMSTSQVTPTDLTRFTWGRTRIGFRRVHTAQ